MATRRYGISKGETEDAIVEAVGAAVAADSIELTIDLAANYEKADVIIKLQELANYILEHNWPPA